MADKSAIEWANATWNPVTGCTMISPGFDHCYAERFSERFQGVPGDRLAAELGAGVAEDAAKKAVVEPAAPERARASGRYAGLSHPLRRGS